jgi:hypothetical protein
MLGGKTAQFQLDPLLTAIQTNLPLFLMLEFILYVIQTTKNIVYEKERKLKVSLNKYQHVEMVFTVLIH